MNSLSNTAGKALTAAGLTKRYGKQTVLENLDVTIRPGCIYGLIGRNGAGKTTLLGILTGQNTKNGGAVTYGGDPVWENPDALADLCFAREIDPASDLGGFKVGDYLRAAALFLPRWDAEYAKRLEEKFEIDRKKRLNKLSKGQLSMVTVLVALASRAPITLLDEPTAGLDVIARERFYRLLLEDYAATGRTFVISTHIIEEAAGVFERVIILDEGKILADRPTEVLVDEFRYLSGPDEAVTAALAARGLTALQEQTVGRHRMVSVRAGADDFAALAADPALRVEPMNLQNVFVALCGHGDEEG